MDFFQNHIIKFYKEHKRDLPWRNTKNPYKIWLSEIILQQTQVKQGLPYYEKFISKYPTIQALANASEDELMRLWQGLGYYSRCRNLYYTAQYVEEKLSSKFPNDFENLLKLKGIGEYTAAAIASFSNNEDVAVFDGNVQRVLSRYFGFEEDLSLGTNVKKLKKLAQELLPKGHSSIYNQAIMEFGALQCTPKSPKCEICTLNKGCYALKNKKIEVLPFKSKRIKQKIRHFNYLCFKSEGRLYLKKRTEKDIWQNLYNFYLIESTHFLEENDIIKIQELKKLSLKPKIEKSTDYKHILTHQIINARFFTIELNKEKDLSHLGLNSYSLEEVAQLGKPILILNYLNDYHF